MRCCVRRVPISENFPIRFPISEIRNRKLLWAFRVFGNQTVIFELIRHTLNLSLQRHKCPPRQDCYTFEGTFEGLLLQLGTFEGTFEYLRRYQLF